MAVSTTSGCMVILTATVFLLFQVGSADLSTIQRYCKSTWNASLCVAALSADAASRRAADVHELAGTSMSLALQNASYNSVYADFLLRRVQDPRLLKVLAFCSRSYNPTLVDAILDASRAWMRNDLYGALAGMSASITAAQACGEELQKLPWPLNEVFADKNQVQLALCNITAVFMAYHRD